MARRAMAVTIPPWGSGRRFHDSWMDPSYRPGPDGATMVTVEKVSVTAPDARRRRVRVSKPECSRVSLGIASAGSDHAPVSFAPFSLVRIGRTSTMVTKVATIRQAGDRRVRGDR